MIDSTARRHTLLIFCILLVAYAYVLPRKFDWNQLSRLSLVRAVVERGTVRIDAYVSETNDFTIHDGHAYTDKAPGPSLMGVPLYAAVLPMLESPVISAWLEWLAGDHQPSDTSSLPQDVSRTERVRGFAAHYLLTLTIIAVPAAAAGALLYHFLAIFEISRGLRVLIVLAYGLGTPAATYAGNFYGQQLAAALCLGAFSLLVWLAQGRGDAARALLAGLLMGYAIISEYPAIIIVAVLGVYAFRTLPRSQFFWMLGGLVIPMALLAVYDMVAFGQLLPITHSYSALRRVEYNTGFMSLSYPDIQALWGLTFSPFRGLFVRSPWLILALLGYGLWWRTGKLRSELLVTMGATGLYVLFCSSSVIWWIGAAAGPRTLVPILPFLALGAVPVLHRLWEAPGAWRLLSRAGSIVLVLGSLGLTWSEAVAGQHFPPDYLHSPWTDYILPTWQKGDVANNIGTLIGLPGPVSLLPLAGLLTVLVLTLALLATRSDRIQPVAPITHSPVFES